MQAKYRKNKEIMRTSLRMSGKNRIFAGGKSYKKHKT